MDRAQEQRPRPPAALHREQRHARLDVHQRDPLADEHIVLKPAQQADGVAAERAGRRVAVGPPKTEPALDVVISHGRRQAHARREHRMRPARAAERAHVGGDGVRARVSAKAGPDELACDGHRHAVFLADRIAVAPRRRERPGRANAGTRERVAGGGRVGREPLNVIGRQRRVHPPHASKRPPHADVHDLLALGHGHTSSRLTSPRQTATCDPARRRRTPAATVDRCRRRPNQDAPLARDRRRPRR